MSRLRPSLDRREFIRLTAVTVAAGTIGPTFAGCDDGGDAETLDGIGPTSAPGDIARLFPQGLASGDPKPTSVVLWTRVELTGEAPVDYEIATDQDFEDPVVVGSLTAKEDSDHTVRVKATELEPGTTYFYRFRADGVTTDWGRTRTAPAADDDAAITFAFASCQDFNGRYYHAWRVLAERDDVDFVVFLGDYIYETGNDPRFQEGTAERRAQILDGIVLDEESGSKAALTLADYRGLYKTYGSDANLQEARRRFPFVQIWDDHEFADDCWQDHATHFNGAQADDGDEQDTARRTAANRAFFEFVPIDVAHDSAQSYPDDIRIYRRLRFGKHVELFMTDQRSYRDDHLIPEGPPNETVGKVIPNSALGARQLLIKTGFDALEADAKPSLLGAEQKAWFINAVNDSNATWKFWGNEVMQGQLALDLSEVEELPESFRGDFYLTVDQWDGFRSERAEVLGAVSGAENLVVLTGDLHANYANELHLDFDAPADPVAVEFVTAGISSRSFQEIIERIVEGNDLLQALGLGPLVARLDELTAARNPHVKYTKNRAYGVGWIQVSADALDVRFLEVDDVTSDAFMGSSGEVKFTVASGSNRIEPA